MNRRTPPGSLVLFLCVFLWLAGAALAVLWLGGVSAFTPAGRTHCGPAVQEWPNLFRDVAGRCHLARQDRLWLGLQVTGAMAAAALAVTAARRVLDGRR